VVAGYDWGGRAACVAAALWPERFSGLVSVNSYLIQDIGKAGLPTAAKAEAGFWYQYYFLTERARAGLTANRRDIARIMWARNSPTWNFDDAMFSRSAKVFDNPDYVDVVIHSYRHRLGRMPRTTCPRKILRPLRMRSGSCRPNALNNLASFSW
jgi:pimeloyl-ACP methyl ester carboxylesterase